MLISVMKLDNNRYMLSIHYVRLTCPKVTEVFLVSLSVPTSMATSTAISLGYQDFCNG